MKTGYTLLALYFLLCTFSQSHAFLLNLLKDVALITQGLTELNTFNQQLVIQGIKKVSGSKNKSDLTAPQSRNVLFNFNLVDAPTSQATGQAGFTFNDLAGNIPVDVREIVDFLRSPENFRQVGAVMPKGILLVGPPGTGKTSIARAIAGEAEAYFFDASGSQFIEVYVGVGPQRVRELFDNARAAVRTGPLKKAIIFIDELDAIGGKRRNDNSGGSSEYRNTLNELLNQMDGFKQDDSILVIGATNTPDSIDAALKRPGRFDRIVAIPLPDEQSREAILRKYAEKIKLQEAIDFSTLANKTKLWSGAELKNLVNEAAVRAAREKAKGVVQAHFDTVLDELTEKKRQEVIHQRPYTLH